MLLSFITQIHEPSFLLYYTIDFRIQKSIKILKPIIILLYNRTSIPHQIKSLIFKLALCLWNNCFKKKNT